MKNKTTKTLLGVVSVARLGGWLMAALAVPATWAAPFLQVDVGTVGQSVQVGFQGFSFGTSPSQNLAPPQNAAYATPFGAVSVTVASAYLAGGAADNGFRIRGPVTGPAAGLSDLVGDHVHANGDYLTVDATMFLTLAGLTAGRYQVQTWHHDAFQNGGSFNPGIIDIYVNGTLAVANVAQSYGASPSSVTSVLLDFTVPVDGGGVVVELRETSVGTGGTWGNGSAAVLNGLELTRIPEPASLVLLLCGGSVLMRRRARR